MACGGVMRAMPPARLLQVVTLAVAAARWGVPAEPGPPVFGEAWCDLKSPGGGRRVVTNQVEYHEALMDPNVTCLLLANDVVLQEDYWGLDGEFYRREQERSGSDCLRPVWPFCQYQILTKPLVIAPAPGAGPSPSLVLNLSSGFPQHNQHVTFLDPGSLVLANVTVLDLFNVSMLFVEPLQFRRTVDADRSWADLLLGWALESFFLGNFMTHWCLGPGTLGFNFTTHLVTLGGVAGTKTISTLSLLSKRLGNKNDTEYDLVRILDTLGFISKVQNTLELRKPLTYDGFPLKDPPLGGNVKITVHRFENEKTTNPPQLLGVFDDNPDTTNSRMLYIDSGWTYELLPETMSHKGAEMFCGLFTEGALATWPNRILFYKTMVKLKELAVFKVGVDMELLANAWVGGRNLKEVGWTAAPPTVGQPHYEWAPNTSVAETTETTENLCAMLEMEWLWLRAMPCEQSRVPLCRYPTALNMPSSPLLAAATDGPVLVKQDGDIMGNSIPWWAMGVFGVLGVTLLGTCIFYHSSHVRILRREKVDKPVDLEEIELEVTTPVVSIQTKDQSDEFEMPSEGKSLNGFRLVRNLGEGAYSKTYLVEPPPGHKPSQGHHLAVMKVPNNRQQMTQVVQEAFFLNLLKSPFIVQHLESVTSKQGALVLVTEFCECGDLAEALVARKVPFSEEFVLHVMMHLLLALYTCHSQKIAHRDIKPANVLISANGVFKLADFGVARLLVDAAETMAGTPLYMAPEMLQGKPYHLSGDVYSLGCVLYELCTLMLPHSATDMESLMSDSHKPNRARWAVAIGSEYSTPLVDLIATMLDPVPANRSSVEDILLIPWVAKFSMDAPRHIEFSEHLFYEEMVGVESFSCSQNNPLRVRSQNNDQSISNLLSGASTGSMITTSSTAATDSLLEYSDEDSNKMAELLLKISKRSSTRY